MTGRIGKNNYFASLHSYIVFHFYDQFARHFFVYKIILIPSDLQYILSYASFAVVSAGIKGSLQFLHPENRNRILGSLRLSTLHACYILDVKIANY